MGHFAVDRLGSEYAQEVTVTSSHRRCIECLLPVGFQSGDKVKNRLRGWFAETANAKRKLAIYEIGGKSCIASYCTSLEVIGAATNTGRFSSSRIRSECTAPHSLPSCRPRRRACPLSASHATPSTEDCVCEDRPNDPFRRSMTERFLRSRRTLRSRKC